VVTYHALPRCQYSDGECVKCHAYPNSTERIMTDYGMKTLVKCRKCGTLMKPRSDDD